MTTAAGTTEGDCFSTRRNVLKLAAVGGATAWAAPAIISVQGAAAQSAGVVVPPAPQNGSVYVYIGASPRFGGLNYTRFATAVSRPLVADQATLPADYSNVAVVIIADNTTLPSEPAQSELLTYLQAGGRVIVQGDADIYATVNTAANAWIAALGGSSTVVPASLDPNCTKVTTAITVHPRTAGVSTLAYAWTSHLTPNGAQVLVTGISGQVLVALQQIGAGLLMTLPDLSVFYDGCPDLYTHGNGQLAVNFLA